MKLSRLFVLPFLGVILSAGVANAALITPIAVTSPNTVDGSAPLVNLINHSGLNSTTFEHTNAFPGVFWRTSSSAASTQLTFDLGAEFLLSGTQIWNYNESGTGGGGAPNTDRGVQTFNISFSTDNVSFSAPQTISLSQAPGATNYLGEFDGFNATVARFVKFNVLTSYGSNNGFTGLSEVRFNTITPQIVPVTTTVNQVANGGGSFGIENLVNNDGMTGVGGELSVPAAVGNGFDGMWRQTTTANGNLVANNELLFDFGTKKEIGAIKIWNYAEDNNTNRGLTGVEVFQSNDGINFSSLGIFSLTQAVNGVQTQHNVIDLNAFDVNARFIRLDAQGVFANNNGFYGLNEVRFFEAAYIPEPASLTGLLMAGVALMRRRRTA